MHSVILHAYIRDAYPVHGCYGIIRELQYKIEQTLMELQVVNAQLVICRKQHHQQHYYFNQSDSGNISPAYNFVAESKESNTAFNPLWVQHYDEMHGFFETFDDRQSYIGNKEAYESSSETSLKKDRKVAVEAGAISENELRSAAACFSLTRVSN